MLILIYSAHMNCSPKKTPVTWIFCIQNRAYVAEIVWERYFCDIIRELVDTKPEKKIWSDLSAGTRKSRGFSKGP